LSDDDADDDDSREPTSPEQAFERKYDGLGPVEFAKQVIQFGDRLGRTGKDLSPADKVHALAEYSFLQDRLSFWLAYDYKPMMAEMNLISAALTLYQGAVNGGIVGPDHLPQSMLDVAGGAWAFDNVPPRAGFSTKPKVDIEPALPAEALEEVEGLGEIVGNSEVGVKWNGGIEGQGNAFDAHVGKQNPNAVRLPPKSKTFDQFDPVEREAISAKTLNTLSVTYIKNPQKIYGKVSGYVNAAANYNRPRAYFDVDPTKIQSRTLQLGIPEYTSPEQWRYLFAAIIHGRENGVRVVITRIRE